MIIEIAGTMLLIL